jgi:hypothetical protein
MVPVSSAHGVDKLDNVDTLANDAARPVNRDALDVLANYSPDIPPDAPEAASIDEPTAKKSRHPLASRKPTRLAPLHEAAVIGVALVGLTAGYFAWRLSEGTISISAAAPLVEDALERVVGGDTKIGSLRLGWDKDARNFVVTAQQITATTSARASPLALGQVTLTLNAGALLQGQTQISRADISGLRAVLVLDQDGAIAFGFGSPEEVLALPRRKAEARGLRPLLDSARKALLLNEKNGRVDAITLTNAQLIVIDPGTNERLTLEQARANITTNAGDVVTLQASGRAREMGGSANVALSASPNQAERIAIAARFENARLSRLPTSLRFGPLKLAAQDSVALSGSALVRLGKSDADTDVQADVRLGGGQLQGFTIASAAAKLDWRSGRLGAILSNVTASGPLGAVEAGNGRVDTNVDGSRAITFEARRVAGSGPSFGALMGENVRGSIALLADNHVSAGNLFGTRLRVSAPNNTDIAAQGFGLVLSSPGRANSNQLQASLTAQDIQGQINGRALGARDLNLDISATRSGQSVTPISVSGGARAARYQLPVAGRQQNVATTDLTLDARDFTSQVGKGLATPRTISARAQGITFDTAQGAGLEGNANGIEFIASGVGSNSARVQGRAGDVSISRSGLQPVGLAGRTILFDITQGANGSAIIQNLQAASLDIDTGATSASTTELVASGRFEGRELRGTKLSAGRVEVRNVNQLERPFEAEALRLSGNFTPRSVALDTFSLRHRGVDLSGATQITRAPRGSPSVNLEADVRGAFSVETLLSAWPRRFLPETRGNIARLIPSGTAEVSRLSLAIPAGMMPKQILPRAAMALDFSVRDVTVTYLRGMSPITDVRGAGQLFGDSLSMDLPEGRIGDVVLTGGRIDIPQFLPRGAHLNVAAQASGDVSAMASEIDMPSLALLTKAGLSPDRLSGNGTAQIALDIPLKRNLQDDEIGIEVDGAFQQAGLSRTFAGLDTYNGTVRLGVRNQKIEVSGMAWMAGNLFDFDWFRDPEATMGSQISLNATGLVTIDSLQAIGIDARAYAQGPFQIDVEASSQGNQLGEAFLTANLTNTNITLPGNVWKKDEGVKAVATARLYPREGGGWNVQELKFDSQGALLRGALDVTDGAKLVDARFSRVVIDNTADISLDVTPGDNAMTVTMRGAYLNLSTYLDRKNVTEKAVDLLDRPLTLSADIAKVATGPGRELTDVHADIVRDQDGWRTFEAAGSAPAGRSQVSLMMQRDGRRRISGVLSDAGFFAQLLYPGAPIFGGTGLIEGELPVVGANSSGSLTFSGKQIQLRREGTSPVMFDNVELPMSVAGGVVTLREGQADGDAYTVKASGYVDVDAGRLDIRGVATPGGLNRVLADIPLFGPILGGGQDEGLLGMTFTARGALMSPRLQTNPISALAPGFLRKLFESEAPLSPQPRFAATPFIGVVRPEKWPYGPTEDMSERPHATGQAVGPTQ